MFIVDNQIVGAPPQINQSKAETLSADIIEGIESEFNRMEAQVRGIFEHQQQGISQEELFYKVVDKFSFTSHCFYSSINQGPIASTEQLTQLVEAANASAKYVEYLIGHQLR
mmetsp:Transcript_39687/g.60810  ORF Transcript_39687/g.60810 Transcript_39687/m.60810 type:complete len:112 (+) Transcript_39687:744-1079(+)